MTNKLLGLRHVGLEVEGESDGHDDDDGDSSTLRPGSKTVKSTSFIKTKIIKKKKMRNKIKIKKMKIKILKK